MKGYIARACLQTSSECIAGKKEWEFGVLVPNIFGEEHLFIYSNRKFNHGQAFEVKGLQLTSTKLVAGSVDLSYPKEEIEVMQELIDKGVELIAASDNLRNVSDQWVSVMQQIIDFDNKMKKIFDDYDARRRNRKRPDPRRAVPMFRPIKSK